MTHLIAILFCAVGFAAFAVTMSRHQMALVGRPLPARTGRGIRVVAMAAMALALAIDMAGLGAGYGAVAWFAHLTAGAAAMLVVVRRA